MPSSAPLYDRAPAAPPVPSGLPLVIALTGFTDAGGAVTRLVEYFRDDLEPNPVVVFDNDVLLDYRARRRSSPSSRTTSPTTDRPGSNSRSRTTRSGTRSCCWRLRARLPVEAFAETVLELSAGMQVSSVTWVHAIPMPVPHTRPIGTTVSGTRPDLAEAHSVWRPHTQVPSTAGHLLEYRFAEAGAKVAGFALLVPHYLGDTEYPAAALAALDSLTVATGLVFSGEVLREENREFIGKVAEQVEGSEELTRMLEGLEERYDSYMAGSTHATPIIHTGDLPSADELAAELERFLATRPGDDDRRGKLG